MSTSALLLLIFIAQGRSDPVVFTNETEYLNSLSTLGYVWVKEGFEDDAVWGHVRSTAIDGNRTASAVTNLGLSWTADNDSSQVSTSSGAAVSGDWGMYALPHGSYGTGAGCTVPGTCGDGIMVSADRWIHGVAAWVRGTFGSKVALFLDGDQMNPVPFPQVCDPGGENCTDYGLLTGDSKFFGMIEPAGFRDFQFRELEGTEGDQKYLWFDDFVVASTNAPPPRIAISTVASNAITLTADGLAVNARYTLERSTSIMSDAWTVAQTFISDGSDTNLTESINAEPPRQFYRLRTP